MRERCASDARAKRERKIVKNGSFSTWISSKSTLPTKQIANIFSQRRGARRRENPNIAIRSLQTSPKQSAWQAWKPLPRGSGAPVEKLEKVVHFPLGFHENRPPEQSELLTISSEPGRPESRKIPDPEMQLAKLWSNNHPGKPGNHWPWPVVDPSKS